MRLFAVKGRLRARRLGRLLLCSAACVVLLLGLALLGVNCAGLRAARMYEADTVRDPDTGIILGAEPVRIAQGRKGACLLLHGWIGSPADFAELVPALAEAGWDVYAPLLPGHGTRPRDLKGVSAQKLLGAAREHYQTLRARYERIAVVGFSMGGTIAGILAAEQPPHKLVLVAPFCGVRHKWYYVLPAGWWNALVSRLIAYAPRMAGTIHCNRAEGRKNIITYGAFHTDASRALFELCRVAMHKTDLSRLVMPALLVYSAGENTCSPSAMESFFGRLPASPKLKAVFERSDHHLLHDHDRREAMQAIVEFLGAP